MLGFNWRQWLLVLLDIIPEFDQHHNLSIHSVIFHQLLKSFFAECYSSAIGLASNETFYFHLLTTWSKINCLVYLPAKPESEINNYKVPNESKFSGW